ncbi:unnamed protein product [Microthlaspi erraticum]|uniref:NB-ARC domain-containing protein n=1 Tax=Microthlaspi erraticum TaxID=1685480 RepID=A0A6D2K2C9_9BRAS|nr:unnamed protein product [Microthlaspi erraticum]
MAETLLSFGVQKLLDLLVRESDRFKGVDEQLTELKRDINLLRSFLKDADAKKHASALVKNCVEEIKEIVFDAEDVIETFLLKEQLGRTSGIRKRIRRLAFIVVDRRELASIMEGISKRISKVIRDMQSFGVQQMIVDGSGCSHPLQERQREMRHTFPSNCENDLVGFEENVKKLVGYLVEEENVQMVSICGMGGIGKTTLARQVFNHETTIFQELSSGYDEHRVSSMTEDKLQDTLFRLLETSKSLIVLDDMWKEEDWDLIKHVFPPKKDPTCVTFKPECLTSEESWTLFRRTAFPKDKVDEVMEEMGKQMVKHCGGLPLAVKVLGGLLAAQYTLREWNRIYENIKSHIVRGRSSFSDRNISSVYNVLYLSFEELPIYLKQCFLYIAHFPEDYAINIENLSYYWAAEGIRRPRNNNGATIRDDADEYIEELVKRNMVISERNVITSRFETCHLHDMMREVCLLKAEEENFLHIVDTSSVTSDGSSQSLCRSCRLVIHSLDYTIHMERYIKNPKLRSLLVIDQYPGLKWMSSTTLCFTRLQFMRVLDLSRATFEERNLPSSIGKLIHLRYLSLYLGDVTHLPSSMRNLKQLLYLNLDVYGYPIYLPNIFKELRELRYLCLPVGIQDSIKLELENLINLETLVNFSTKHSSLTDLQHMTRLVSLSISVRGGCNLETLPSSLGKLRNLANLVIDGAKMRDSFGHGFEETLCGRRMVFSSGGFPKLQMLDLRGLQEWEEWIVEEGSMPLLHALLIYGCDKLEELPDGLRFITCLEYLVVRPISWEFLTKLRRGGEDYYKVQHICHITLDYEPENFYYST